jgi:hypothetical protein
VYASPLVVGGQVLAVTVGARCTPSTRGPARCEWRTHLAELSGTQLISWLSSPMRSRNSATRTNQPPVTAPEAHFRSFRRNRGISRFIFRSGNESEFSAGVFAL